MQNVYKISKTIIDAEQTASLHNLHASFPEDEDSPVEEMGNNTSPAIPLSLYFHLPPLLQACCVKFDVARERDVFLTGALSVLSGCFPQLKGLYRGKMHYSNLYSFVIAPPASGKGVLNYAKALGYKIHATHTGKNTNAINQYKSDLAKYNAECKRDKDAAANLFPPTEPSTRLLYIPGNSSSASVMKLVQHNEGRGIICETEADTVANSLKADWGGFSDLLRKSFHHEDFSYSRKTNNEYCEVNNPQISIAITGTPNQVGNLLGSNEDGLVSRFLFYSYQAAGTWSDVSPNGKDNLDEYFKDLSERVYKIHETLQDKVIEFDLTREQWARLNRFFEAKLTMYPSEFNSTVYRMGLILYRISMILTVLRNEEDLDTSKLICSDVDYQCAQILADVYLAHAAQVHQTLLRPVVKRSMTGKLRFYAELPPTGPFLRGNALKVGEALNIGTRTIDKYLQQLVHEGLLQTDKHGIYRKM